MYMNFKKSSSFLKKISKICRKSSSFFLKSAKMKKYIDFVNTKKRKEKEQVKIK
jgi:hypothetical protein